MRILLCSLSSALGGLERRLETETRLLAAAGHEVLVATPHFPGFDSWQTAIELAGGKWISWTPYKFFERRQFAAPFRWLCMLSLPFLRAQRIHIAHIVKPWTFHGLSMAFVLRRANIPFLISVQCKLSGQPMPDQGQPFARQAMRGLIGGYVVSRPVLDSFMKYYAGLLHVNPELQVIPNGIDTECFRPNLTARNRIRRALRLRDDEFAVMFCGRLDPMKRPLFALRVFAALLARGLRSRLLIVGDGPQMEDVKKETSRLGIERNVLIIGRVSETAPYYAACDCYLSTSANMEGFPLATSEALAAGLPAVVPNDDVFESAYAPCPAVQRCDPNDVREWIDAIYGLASADAVMRRGLAEEGRRFAVRDLSLDVMNRRLTVFYEGVFSRLPIHR